jgi:hypothetical protein
MAAWQRGYKTVMTKCQTAKKIKHWKHLNSSSQNVGFVVG